MLLVLSPLAVQTIASQTPSLRDSDLGENSRSDIQSKRFVPKTVVGEQRTLVILVELTDVRHSFSENEIYDLVFVSMKAYWEEVSYGKISITGKIVGWKTLGNTMASYGADSSRAIDDPNGDGEDDSWWLIRDTVSLVDGEIDFRDYKHIIVMHAGIGQESNSKASTNIWSVFFDDLSIPTNDGVSVTSGIIVPEGENPGGIKSTLGVLAHEFGHSLGLADLYMYTHKNVETLEDWSVMDHGEWLGSPPGSCPAHLEAWGRIQLGWITPVVVQPLGQTLHISPLEDAGEGIKAVKIELTDETYYIIEVRRKVGFDRYLPGEGVLITRIDEGRKSGEGIIRLLDAVPSTIGLGDAAFQVGQNFEDNANHVYVRIHSKSDLLYQTILSRKPIVLAKIYATDRITAGYYDEVTLSALLVDSRGMAVPRMSVHFECIALGMPSIYLGRSVTDGSGRAFLKIALDLRPGDYLLRYSLTGGEFGEYYYLPDSTQSTLTISKKRTILRYEGPVELTALDQTAVRIRTLSSDNRPIPRVPVSVYLDEQIQEKTLSNEQGYVEVTLSFSLLSLGTHRLRMEVPENEFCERVTSTASVSVVFPGWLWILILVLSVLLVLSLFSRFQHITSLKQRALGIFRSNQD